MWSIASGLFFLYVRFLHVNQKNMTKNELPCRKRTEYQPQKKQDTPQAAGELAQKRLNWWEDSTNF